jgi:hypothetical protein
MISGQILTRVQETNSARNQNFFLNSQAAYIHHTFNSQTNTDPINVMEATTSQSIHVIQTPVHSLIDAIQQPNCNNFQVLTSLNMIVLASLLSAAISMS